MARDGDNHGRRGVCMVRGVQAGEMATNAGSMHPTGMNSCSKDG